MKKLTRFEKALVVVAIVAVSIYLSTLFIPVLSQWTQPLMLVLVAIISIIYGARARDTLRDQTIPPNIRAAKSLMYVFVFLASALALLNDVINQTGILYPLRNTYVVFALFYLLLYAMTEAAVATQSSIMTIIAKPRFIIISLLVIIFSTFIIALR